MKVLEYIAEHGLESLERDFAIDIKRYPNGYVMLNYDMINSPKHNPLVDECRGLLIYPCADGDWYVACRSFDRFYNHGEDPRSFDFPVNLATAYEKVDGSLVRVWFDFAHTCQWQAATRSMAFAEGPTAQGNTFLKVIERALGKSVNEFMKSDTFADDQWTYIFELVSPETRVVKPYGEDALYLLALRHNDSGAYEHDVFVDTYAREMGVRRPAKYTFKNWAECLEASKNLPNSFDEGYVLRLEDWRIKVKSPSYLALAHLHNNGAMSVSRIVNMVWHNDEEEYLAYFPEDRQAFTPWQLRRDALKLAIFGDYEKYRDIESQKDFALAVKNLPYAGWLFSLRKGMSLSDVFKAIGEKGVDGKASDSLISLLEKIPV